MNNILLKVINISFSTLKFTIVLKSFFYIASLFVHIVFRVATTLLNAQVRTS